MDYGYIIIKLKAYNNSKAILSSCFRIEKAKKNL